MFRHFPELKKELWERNKFVIVGPLRTDIWKATLRIYQIRIDFLNVEVLIDWSIECLKLYLKRAYTLTFMWKHHQRFDITNSWMYFDVRLVGAVFLPSQSLFFSFLSFIKIVSRAYLYLSMPMFNKLRHAKPKKQRQQQFSLISVICQNKHLCIKAVMQRAKRRRRKSMVSLHFRWYKRWSHFIFQIIQLPSHSWSILRNILSFAVVKPKQILPKWWAYSELQLILRVNINSDC